MFIGEKTSNLFPKAKQLGINDILVAYSKGLW